LLRNTNRLVDTAFGNWVMGAIYIYQAGLPAQLSRGGGNLEVVHTQHYGRKRLTNLAGDQVIRGMGACVGWYDPNPAADDAGGPSAGNAPYTLGDIGQQEPYTGDPYAGCQRTSTGHAYDFIARPSYAAVTNVSDSGVRRPRLQNLDLSLSKSFSVWREAKLQMRFEGYNVLNHPSWAGLDYWTDIFDPNFGTENMKYDNQSNAPRQVQLSGKIIW
jgi:hypothetical protein